jgi:sugar phosphate isomerase/epimerase
MVKPRTGCSIPFNYLAGAENCEFESLFGSPKECLELFKSKGVNSVELRSVSTATSPEDIPKAVERVLAAGLELTVHAALPDFNAPDPLAIFAALPDVELILTIHAYAGASHSERWHADKTVDGFHLLLEGTPSNLRFALEVNRAREGRIDPGNNYQGVLEMVERIDSPRVGVCWDFGHSTANAANGSSPLFPERDFLNRVIHTHIHDLSEKGTTHFPLTYGKTPLRDCIAFLDEAGYQGYLNFEPGIDRWPGTTAEKREAMLTSIEILNIASNF